MKTILLFLAMVPLASNAFAATSVTVKLSSAGVFSLRISSGDNVTKMEPTAIDLSSSTYNINRYSRIVFDLQDSSGTTGLYCGWAVDTSTTANPGATQPYPDYRPGVKYPAGSDGNVYEVTASKRQPFYCKPHADLTEEMWIPLGLGWIE